MQESLHYLLMGNHTMLQKRILAELVPLGLTSGQPKVLDYLQTKDGSVQKEIALGCHIEPASLSGILNGMERKGLIVRRGNAENRRETKVYLTDSAEKVCQRLNAAFATAEAEALRGLTEEERGQLQQLLKKVYENLSPEDRKESRRL